MIEAYNLEKDIWTTDDFEQMGWHDCKIYAIAFDESNFKLLFDVDYIFMWVGPREDGYYKFWISPVTLVFENVYDVEIDLGSQLSTAIEDIERTNPNRPNNSDYINENTEWDWCIETINGHIKFKSVGYKQYVRKSPLYKRGQEIGLEERGGYSFSTEFIK